MKFESWMIGMEVQEISTGDRGEVVGRYPAAGEDGIDILWATGAYAGETLWLDLDKIVFIDKPLKGQQDDPIKDSIKDKLAQIEFLVAEIKAIL